MVKDIKMKFGLILDGLITDMQISTKLIIVCKKGWRRENRSHGLFQNRKGQSKL